MRFYIIFLMFLSFAIMQNFGIASDLALLDLEETRYWEVSKRKEKLYEYSHDDIFSVFGLKRVDGVRQIISVLGSNFEVNQCISNALLNEDEKILKDIFSEKTLAENRITFSKNLRNKQDYLNGLLKKNYGIWLGHNFDYEKNNLQQNRDFKDTLGIEAALAHLQRKNVYIYKKGSGDHEGKLVLVHRVVIEGLNKCVRALLHDDGHYSLLLSSEDPKDLHNQAKINEKYYLNQEKYLKTKALSEEQAKKPLAVSNSEISNITKLSTSNNFANKNSHALPIRSPKSAILYSLPVDSSLLKPKQLIARNAVNEKENSQPIDSNKEISPKFSANTDKRPIASPQNVFTKKDVMDFINRKRLTLLSYSRAQSLAMAYQFLRQQINDKPLNTEKTLGYFLGTVRLSLEFNFHPENLTHEEHIQNVLIDLQKIILKFHNSKDATLRKFANYARIFAGRCLVILSRYDEAIDEFFSVKSAYTKVWHLDVAKLAIDGHYAPRDLGPMSLEEWALEFLNFKDNSTKRSNSEKRANGNGNENSVSKLAHPLFLSAPKVKKQIKKVKNQIRRNSLVQEENEKEPINARAKKNSSKSHAKHSLPTDIEEYSIKKRRKNSQYSDSPLYRGDEEILNVEYSTNNNNDFDDASTDVEQGVIESIEHVDEMHIIVEEERENNVGDIEYEGSSPQQDIDLNFYPEDESDYIEYQENIIRGKVATRGETEAIQQLQKALLIAERLDDKILIAEASVLLAHKQNDIKKSILCYERALMLLNDSDEPALKAEAYLGLLQKKENELTREQHFKYCNDAFNLLKGTTNFRILAKVYIAFGYYYLAHNDLKSAASNFENALGALSSIHDRFVLAQAYLGLSEAQRNTTGYNQVLLLLDRANVRHREYIARAYIGLARYPEDEKERIKLYQRAIETLDGVYAPSTKARAYIGLAKLSYETINSYKSALDVVLGTQHTKFIAWAYVGLSEVKTMPDADRINYAKKALEITKHTNLYKLRAEAFMRLGYLENSSDSFRKAMDIYLRFIKDNPEFEIQICIGLGSVEGTEEGRIFWCEKALTIIENLEKPWPKLKILALVNFGFALKTGEQAAQKFRLALDVLDGSEIRDHKKLRSKIIHGMISEICYNPSRNKTDLLEAKKLYEDMKTRDLDKELIKKSDELIRHFENGLIFDEFSKYLYDKSDRELTIKIARDLALKLTDQYLFNRAQEMLEIDEKYLNSPQGKCKLIFEMLNKKIDQEKLSKAKKLFEEMKADNLEPKCIENAKSIIQHAEGSFICSEIKRLLYIKTDNANKERNLREAKNLLKKMKDENLAPKLIPLAEEEINKQDKYLSRFRRYY